MADKPTSALRSRCINCGFEAPAGGDEWDAVDDPTLGTLTRCPECGSTNILSRR